MVRLIFILSIVGGFAVRSNAQEINWDSLFVNNKSKEDSLKDLRSSLNRYSEYWHNDSQANNGFRFLYGVELFEKVPMDCLPVDYLIFYLGKPYEIYEFDEECTIYEFLRLQEGNDPNKNHNYYALLCFCVDPKTKIVEKSYFAFNGH